MRTHLLWLRRKPCEDASNPTYTFVEPRVGDRSRWRSDRSVPLTSYHHSCLSFDNRR